MRGFVLRFFCLHFTNSMITLCKLITVCVCQNLFTLVANPRKRYSHIKTSSTVVHTHCISYMYIHCTMYPICNVQCMYIHV